MATIADISSSILGLFYSGYLPTFWVRLRVSLPNANNASNLPLDGYWPESWLNPSQFPPALTLTFLVMACIWAADIGAYTMGKKFWSYQIIRNQSQKNRRGGSIWRNWQFDCGRIGGLVFSFSRVAGKWGNVGYSDWYYQSARRSYRIDDETRCRG